MVIGQYSDLSEKTILVTGASSGIGKAVAVALSDQGATVVITGRNRERLEETLSQLNGQCRSITADITQPEDRNALIEQLPGLNGICHAAGIIHPFPLRMMQETQLDKVMSVNFTAPVLITCELLKKRKINEGASLVFISSIGSTYNMKGGSSYSASKAALEAFSRSIVLEHASKRIRSNCLKPGLVRTPIYDQITQVSYNAGLKNYEPNYPLGLGEAEDIASATLFFLSDASRWIASTTLTMDGGLTAGV